MLEVEIHAKIKNQTLRLSASDIQALGLRNVSYAFCKLNIYFWSFQARFESLRFNYVFGFVKAGRYIFYFAISIAVSNINERIDTDRYANFSKRYILISKKLPNLFIWTFICTHETYFMRHGIISYCLITYFVIFFHAFEKVNSNPRRRSHITRNYKQENVPFVWETSLVDTSWKTGRTEAGPNCTVSLYL